MIAFDTRSWGDEGSVEELGTGKGTAGHLAWLQPQTEGWGLAMGQGEWCYERVSGKDTRRTKVMLCLLPKGLETAFLICGGNHWWRNSEPFSFFSCLGHHHSLGTRLAGFPERCWVPNMTLTTEMPLWCTILGAPCLLLWKNGKSLAPRGSSWGSEKFIPVVPGRHEESLRLTLALQLF